MRKSICLLLLFPLWSYCQEIDSLQILKQHDWKTLDWFNKDTVYLSTREKIDTNFVGLNSYQIMKKKKKNLYGERIHFNASGKLTYINNMACPVGETITKLYSINLKGKKLIVDFESKKWPWKKNKTIREKRTFKIITWSSDMIVLK